MHDDVCVVKEKSCIFVVAKYSFYLKTFNKNMMKKITVVIAVLMSLALLLAACLLLIERYGYGTFVRYSGYISAAGA